MTVTAVRRYTPDHTHTSALYQMLYTTRCGRDEARFDCHVCRILLRYLCVYHLSLYLSITLCTTEEA